jgi:hypothetical protein
MNATALSTDETNRLIDLMPPAHAALVRKACDTHQKACAKAARASAAHSQQVSAGIRQAIAIHRRQLEVLHHCNRTSYLMQRLQASPDKYGLTQTPDRETVKKQIDAEFKEKAAH